MNLSNLVFHGKKVLFIGAHPDDIELGCGAFISNIISKADVHCITLSDNQKNPLLTNLVDEHHQSMSILGVPRDNITLGEFETRRFKHDRQEILEFLITLRKKIEPQMVFVHTKSDLHQDHQMVTQESLRGFRGLSVFGFDVIRSSHGFFPTFLVEITESDIQKKVDALSAYTTYCDKYYFDPELTKAILIRNGALAERPYAEGFDIIRMIGEFSV